MHLSPVFPSPDMASAGAGAEAEAEAGASTSAATGGPSHAAPNPPIPVASNRVAPDDGEETERGGPGAREHSVLPMKVLFDRTVSLLKRSDFQSADPRSFKGLKKRLEMMRDAGLPRMRLLPGEVLEELGRIPRSTERGEDGEPYTVDALEVIESEGFDDDAGTPNSIIVFFSHRWLRANYSTLHQRDVEWGSAEWKAAREEGHYVGMPDSEGNEKVRDLIEWMRWLKWRTSRETRFMENYLAQDCQDVYFFIDWPCVDQTNPEAEICALPAFVSSCSLIASYFTEEYRERGWCQAELLVSRAFCALPVVMRVPVGFKHEEQLFLTAGQFTLPDPSDKETAMITNEDDRPTIAALTRCARKTRAFRYAQCARNVASGTGFGGKGSGLLFLVVSLGLVPLLFRRKVMPGKSVIQLVEPCGDRVPHSWTQVKLWFHLSPAAAVGSMFCVFASLLIMGVSVHFFATEADPAVWHSYLAGSFSALLSLFCISLSAMFYPSIEQAMAPEVMKRLVVGAIAGLVLVLIGLVASAVTS